MAKKEIRFWRARHVADIAEELIPQFHEHLMDETIVYVFRSQAAEKKGRVSMGSVRKKGGLDAYLAYRNSVDDTEAAQQTPDDGVSVRSFFVVEVAHDIWSNLDSSKRIALVDHLLCSITPDGVVGPDVEEFRAVIERHGLWQPNLEDFAKAMKATPLFDAIEAMRPKPGSGIESVTFGIEGEETVTLYAKDVH